MDTSLHVMHGTYGDVTFDDAGWVREGTMYGVQGDQICIFRVDVAEFSQQYPKDPVEGDILDFGYWFVDPRDMKIKFEPPEPVYRSGVLRGQ